MGLKNLSHRVGAAGMAPVLIVWFGLSQLTVLLQSVLVPFLVVALISVWCQANCGQGRIFVVLVFPDWR